MTISPAALKAHYSRFLQPGRTLLTGHSHQAWPDAAMEGIARAFEDAALHVDDKWGRAFAVADDVRHYIASLLGAQSDEIALAPNTHDLVLRFLSAIDLASRPHLVSTTGEFHTISRQLRRLEESGLVSVTWVDARPVATLAERLMAAASQRTAAILTSHVLFETSEVVPSLGGLGSDAAARGIHLLVDAYHSFGCRVLNLDSLGGPHSFVVAGGYKYAQFGEGVCFMRVPPRKEKPWRPLITGWFAGFHGLGQGTKDTSVNYGSTGAEAFAGSTYDPVSHYRAQSVIEFFRSQGLTPANLAHSYDRQTQLLLNEFSAFDVRTPQESTRRGGFVSIYHPRAQRISEALKEEGIWTDVRGQYLRFGPAPYLTDDEILAAAHRARQLLTSP